MASPAELYDAVVRALEADAEPDPDPDSPTGPDGRLAAFATINDDEHDAGGHNRDLDLPGLDVEVDSEERIDDGDAMGVWTGEWEYEDGHPVGRIFEKKWYVRFALTITKWAGDDDHSLTDLNDDLESALGRFDTQMRGDFLVDGEGNALQGIKTFVDLGGSPATGQSNVRQFVHEAESEFVQRISERDEYGPTPTVKSVLVPFPDEHHAGDEFDDSIEGDVADERIGQN